MKTSELLNNKKAKLYAPSKPRYPKCLFDFMASIVKFHNIAWRDMVICGFRENLICEDWVITDLAEQLLRSNKRRSK